MNASILVQKVWSLNGGLSCGDYLEQVIHVRFLRSTYKYIKKATKPFVPHSRRIESYTVKELRRSVTIGEVL
jgi:hypothetical protein